MGTITIEFVTQKRSKERWDAILCLNKSDDSRWKVSIIRQRVIIRMPDDLLENPSDDRKRGFYETIVNTYGRQTWEAVDKSVWDEILRQYRDKWEKGERDPPMLTEGADGEPNTTVTLYRHSLTNISGLSQPLRLVQSMNGLMEKRHTPRRCPDCFLPRRVL
jgi:hypothetical protein